MNMDILEHVNQIYQQSLHDNQNVLQYFYERGISPDTIQKFEVGFSDSYCLNPLKHNHKQQLKNLGLLNDKGNERNWNRLMLPIRDAKGQLVGYNGRSLKPDEQIKYLLSPESMGFNKSTTLYNLHQAKDVIKEKDHVFLVEGVFDVMSMHQMGIENVVCSLGTSLSKEQIGLLANYTSNVVFAYDGDFPGFEASIKNSITLSKTMNEMDKSYEFDKSTRYLMMPNEIDPGDLLTSPGLLKPILHDSKTYSEYCKASCELNPSYEQVFKKIRKGAQIDRELQQIPKGVKQQLLNHLDITEVVSDYAQLQKSGKDFKCRCPFHQEKTASLVVSKSKQIFKCFGCGEGGDALKFVAKIEGVNIKEAASKLINRYNLNVDANVFKQLDRIDKHQQINQTNKKLAELAKGFFDWREKNVPIEKRNVQESELGKYLERSGFKTTDVKAFNQHLDQLEKEKIDRGGIKSEQRNKRTITPRGQGLGH